MVVAARHALRLAAKDRVADAIQDENELAGGIAKLLLIAFEQADTRSWETLPAYLSLVRVPLTPGPHQLSVNINAFDSRYSNIQHRRVIKLNIKPGERQYRLIRAGVNTQTQSQ